MFTGMLKVLPNDDSLATILGHEMSHAVLQHVVSHFLLYKLLHAEPDVIHHLIG